MRTIIINVDGSSVLKAIAALLLLCLVINIVRLSFGLDMDDSDKSKWKRSGLRVLTDHKTGVEYLETRGGGLCVRVDERGLPSVPASIKPHLK